MKFVNFMKFQIFVNFMSFMKFTMELSEAIELKAQQKEFEVDPRNASYVDVVKDRPVVVTHFECLLEDWCRQVEHYLEESLDKPGEMIGPGPRTELEYWRDRMQKITSITEQLQSKESKTVFGVLHAVTRVGQDVALKSR